MALHVAFRRPERLFEYFVQVGLQEPLLPLQRESERPITSLCVVYDRDPTPEGYEKLEFSVSNGSGNLCAGGNVFSSAVWLCVSRSVEKDLGAITDIGILYRDRDDGGKLPNGYTLLDADLNRGSYGYNIGLYYTRQRLPGSKTGPVLDIGIVNAAKNDSVPPKYRIIGTSQRRNVNAGSFRDEIYLVMKHAVHDPMLIAYKPTVLDRYPTKDMQGSPLPASVALFCCPEGIELLSSMHGPPPATYSSFVLTTDASVEIYCACLTFYESFQGEIPDVEEVELEEERIHKTTKDPNAKSPTSTSSSTAATPSATATRPRARLSGNFASLGLGGGDSSSSLSTPPIYVPRKLCFLSYWPYYENFHTILEELYRHARTPSNLPLERLLSQVWSTPLPGSGRMRVILELGGGSNSADSNSGMSSPPYPSLLSSRLITFDRPLPDDFPLLNLPITLLFRILSLPNIMIILSAILQEKKVILTSRILPLLTYIAESLRALLFPFKWTHPYIPILPAPLTDILESPMPIFVGINETYLEGKVLTGEDLVIVYLERDEIRVGGNGKEAYSTKSIAHVATNPSSVGGTTSSASGPSIGTTAAKDSSSSSSSSSSDPFSSIPEKIPHLTLLPRSLLQRLVSDLRTHTRVLKLRKLTPKELATYFQCFTRPTHQAQHHTHGGSSTLNVCDEEDEIDDVALPRSEHSTPARSRNGSNSNSRQGSMTNLYHHQNGSSGGGSGGWSSGGSGTSSTITSSHPHTRAIRACFLHIFITLLNHFDLHLRFPSSETRLANHSFAHLFDLRSFLEGAQRGHRSFLKALTSTQMFSYLVEEKTECQDVSRAIELAFFSHAQVYARELEQSLESLRKRGIDTPNLNGESHAGSSGHGGTDQHLGVIVYLSQSSNSTSEIYHVPPPDMSGLTEVLYSYPSFPRKLDTDMMRVTEAKDIPRSATPVKGRRIDSRNGSVSTAAGGANVGVSTSSSGTSSVSRISPSSSTLFASDSSSSSSSSIPTFPLLRSSSDASSVSDEGSVLYSPSPTASTVSATPSSAGSATSSTSQASTPRGSMSGVANMNYPTQATNRQPSYSVSVSMAPPSITVTTSLPPTTRHMKSLSHGGHNNALLPVSMLTQTSLPRSASGTNVLLASQQQSNLSQTQTPGRVMFNGQKGPVAANAIFGRSASDRQVVTSSGAPSSTPTFATSQTSRTLQIPTSSSSSSSSHHEKKDTLTSIIDFLTTVKQKVPPTPRGSIGGGTATTAASSTNNAGMRTAPSTPQRTPSSSAAMQQRSQQPQQVPGSARVAPQSQQKFHFQNGATTTTTASSSIAQRPPPASAMASSSRPPQQPFGTPLKQPNFNAAVNTPGRTNNPTASSSSATTVKRGSITQRQLYASENVHHDPTSPQQQ